MIPGNSPTLNWTGNMGSFPGWNGPNVNPSVNSSGIVNVAPL
jgi:hypothetical protein